MIAALPHWDIIKATKQLGFKNPEDRKWAVVNIPTNNAPFIKHECKCLNRTHKDNSVIEVIMKICSFPNIDKEKIYYFGQCMRCETIYWTD